tara:strand:+ start:309 stop:494 length:186 start_codon:yes stop_codon:yes gene_type:complete
MKIGDLVSAYNPYGTEDNIGTLVDVSYYRRFGVLGWWYTVFLACEQAEVVFTERDLTLRAD